MHKMLPKATVAFGAVFGLNFPSNSKCGIYLHSIYMVAIISDMKIQIIFFYKIVTFNFLDAKNGPEGNQTLFFWQYPPEG